MYNILYYINVSPSIAYIYVHTSDGVVVHYIFLNVFLQTEILSRNLQKVTAKFFPLNNIG